MFLLLAGCQARPGMLRPVLESEGGLYVYFAPLPQEAARLTYRVESVSARREDGALFPLAVSFREVNLREGSRERLAALGALPPGRYSGLTIKVRDAILKGEDGDSALLLPEEPSRIDVPFDVNRRRGTVLVLSLLYRESLHSGFRFLPAFHAVIPGKLAVGLDAFATSRAGNTVTVFDKLTGRVVGVIPTGAGPSGMALDPRRRKAYVALSGDDAVELIDILSGESVDRVRLAPGDAPAELVLTPDGNTLLSVNAGSNTVSVIDPVSLFEEVRIPVGTGPQSILVDRNGRRAYVFNASSDSVSVLDLPGRRVAATVPTEAEPVRGDFSRDGKLLYVAHRSSPYLAVLDPVTLAVVRRIYVGTGATALKVDARTNRIYLARTRTGQVEIFDPIAALPSDFIATGGDVSFITIDGEGNNLLLVLPGERGVRMVGIVNRKTVAQVDVGDDPYGVTLMGER